MGGPAEKQLAVLCRRSAHARETQGRGSFDQQYPAPKPDSDIAQFLKRFTQRAAEGGSEETPEYVQEKGNLPYITNAGNTA